MTHRGWLYGSRVSVAMGFPQRSSAVYCDMYRTRLFGCRLKERLDRCFIAHRQGIAMLNTRWPAPEGARRPETITLAPSFASAFAMATPKLCCPEAPMTTAVFPSRSSRFLAGWVGYFREAVVRRNLNCGLLSAKRSTTVQSCQYCPRPQ